MSDASSVYSDKRMSTHRHKRSNSSGSSFSYNYSFPENSTRNSVALSTSTKEQSRRPSASSSLHPASSTQSNGTSDPRFSEFYDAYYRHSQLGVAQRTDVKRPNQLNLTQPTIIEVPSPMASPMPQSNKPGMAL
ncbi:hypothetical protein K469DRAFT_705084 [Zopfia rhizophila CBS 207.26]|uniref:Uncharacterized protein n=1 Tax=Zopfia rhizophila CBS 207.26 TaxID=1314779 RepID=A0A6A6EC44_9PEZI|nr:hypothetical protein K469DRAFT_705084 [Zopfia rhizophila CBS 207.26]